MEEQTVINHLIDLFFNVRDYLLQAQFNKQTVGINSKGHETKQFDIDAETITIEYLLNYFPKSKILSEERGVVNESGSDSLFIVDPVDGSYNYAHGIPHVGYSIAVIEGDDIGTETVTSALIGNVFSGSYITAVKGSGAFLRDRSIGQNPNVLFEDAIVTCSLSHLPQEHYLLFHGLEKVFGQIRSLGSTVIELSYVIQGITAAHYDFRKRLTAENFLAASLILKEMGGNLTDLYGNPISEIQDLKEGYSIIASHRAEEHDKYLKALTG